MRYVLLSLLLLAACKPIVNRGVRTNEAAFACVEQGLLKQIYKAEKSGRDDVVKSLNQNGCFTLPPHMEVRVLKRVENDVYIEAHKLGMMRLAPGMEKIKSLKAWIHADSLDGLQ